MAIVSLAEEMLPSILQYEYIKILFYNSIESYLYTLHSVGNEGKIKYISNAFKIDNIVKYRYPMGITGSALQGKKAIIAMDGKANFEFNPGIDNLVGAKSVNSLLVIPLMGEQEYIGVIQLINRQYTPINDKNIVNM